MTAVTLTSAGAVFYSQGDEDAFFAWLGRIPAVEGVHRHDVRLKSGAPCEADLRELLAAFYRYSLNMAQFAQLETAENTAWFRKPGAYWYAAVFEPL